MTEPTAAERPELVLGPAAALRLLRHGALTVTGRLVDASNATLYGHLDHEGVQAACVYKPVAGERPLWDFPEGTLAAREVAAHAVSEATGWGIVPPTVYRDGPFGPGMCQLWIDVDESVDVLALIRGGHPQLRRMVVLDAVVNNADRKGGHLLPTRDGHVYGVDHGVCFAVPDKLRTVLWQWRGRRLPDDVLGTLQRLAADLDGALGDTLAGLLDPEEVEATRQRVRRLRTTGRFPEPSDQWPAVPWPPF